MSLPAVERERNARFPTEFRFGVADADLQVVGERHTLTEEGSEPTMWRSFTQERGLPTPDEGVDRYHLWQEDIEQMRRMGARHYRTSISMSRLLTREGEANSRAVEWYRRYFGALKEAGIAVYATLYHWELPQYLNERGGWTSRETAFALQRHAQVAAERLGDLIDEYFILNEPWCSSFLSYYEGIHASGSPHKYSRENLKAAILAAHHLLLGQGLAYRSIRERAPDARVGTVLNFQPAYTHSTAPDDVRAAQYRDGYFNTWFLDPVYMGRYPDLMVELYGEGALPPGYEGDMDVIKIGDKLHALGVNYYRGGMYRAGGVGSGDLRSEEVVIEGGPTNSLDWPIFQPPHYPEGLYDILQQVYYGYRAFGLERLYVTENGIALATPWDGELETIDDGRRVEYIRQHIGQVHKALLHGIPVEAYFAWTLMDNFEWAEGYRPEAAFGLIHVDRESLKRVWKRSASWYGRLIGTHVIAEADEM